MKQKKGISPVIATILMVMLTVGLVAFSYTWFRTTGEGAKEQSETQLTQLEKASQGIEIPIAYQCDSDICFEIKASVMNSLTIPMNGNGYYVNNVPKTISAWDGGISGTSCNSTDLTLALGTSCYGKITNYNCTLGDTLKVAISWGAEETKQIDGCS